MLFISQNPLRIYKMSELSVDKVFCISLVTSTGRQERFSKEFSKLILSDKFEWLYVNKDDEKGLGWTPLRSSFENHQKAIRIAKERNYKTIIVFEDDAKLIGTWENFVNVCNMKKPSDWVYLMLGYFPVKVSKTDNPNLYVINCAYDAHAYMVNVPKTHEIVYTDTCKQFDFYFCNCHSYIDIFKNPLLLKDNDSIKIGQTYGVYPMAVEQELKDSDISNKHLDKVHFFNFYNGYDNSIKVASHINTLEFAVFIFVWIFLLLLISAIMYYMYISPQRVKHNQFLYLCIFTLITTMTSVYLIISNNTIIKLNY